MIYKKAKRESAKRNLRKPGRHEDAVVIPRSARRRGTGGRNAVVAAREAGRTLPAPQRGAKAPVVAAQAPVVAAKAGTHPEFSWLDRGCEKCGASPGMKCQTASGRATSQPHAARK